jgi:hypothetical protein
MGHKTEEDDEDFIYRDENGVLHAPDLSGLDEESKKEVLEGMVSALMEPSLVAVKSLGIEAFSGEVDDTATGKRYRLTFKEVTE